MDNVSLISKAMADLGLSQAELATRSGIASGLLGRYLTRKITVGLKNAPRLAAALGLTVNQVLFGEEQAKPNEAA